MAKEIEKQKESICVAERITEYVERGEQLPAFALLDMLADRRYQMVNGFGTKDSEYVAIDYRPLYHSDYVQIYRMNWKRATLAQRRRWSFLCVSVRTWRELGETQKRRNVNTKKV